MVYHSSIGQIEISEFVQIVEKPDKIRSPHGSRNKECVIVLSGPTCAGKTDISLLLATSMHGEVVSADSMQVYRGMDVGTAKVCFKERSRVPHHLIDIREVHEPFNVVDFTREAKESCKGIHARGSVPIITGGTGFYIHSLIYGAPDGPPPDKALRAHLEEEAKTIGLDVLYNRLEQLDPEYAATITVHDSHKIVRALEIIELSGQKVSRFGWRKKKSPKDYHFLCYFLYRPRSTLYSRIDRRCDSMLEMGLLDEVIELERKGLRENRVASQAIGYRHCLDYLDSKKDEAAHQYMVEEFKKASRHYAKRQFTWFRKEPLFRWLDLDLHDPETVVDIITCDYQAWEWHT